MTAAGRTEAASAPSETAGPSEASDRARRVAAQIDDERAARPVRRVLVLPGPRPVGAPCPPHVVEHVEAMADALPDWEFVVVEQRGAESLTAPQRRPVARGVRLPARLLFTFITGAGRRGVKSVSRVGLPRTLAELDRTNVRYQAFDRWDSAEAVSFVSVLDAWLVVCLEAPPPASPLLSAARVGAIALTTDVMPRNDQPRSGARQRTEGPHEAGVSVYWVDESGAYRAPLHRAVLPIARDSTSGGLAVQLDVLGSAALVEALRRVARGAAPADPPSDAEPPSTPSPPVITNQEQPVPAGRWTGACGLGSLLRACAKAAVFVGLLALPIPIRNWLRRVRGRCHVRVLLFHRVSDSYRDSITVGIEQFRNLLQMIKHGYDVLDMPEFLESQGRPRRRPAVVLTFDDGYQDNYLAAVLLRREGMPCTFFVATRIVGQEGAAFPHDLKNLKHSVPALSWDEVRRMHQWGFQIGSHTTDHTDLAEVPLDDALGNVALAAADLREKLGASNPGARWLAYPYGGERDITEDVRQRLPDVGVTHCLSAYGGTNPTDFEVLNIRRQNIDCHFGTLRALMALEGWLAHSAPTAYDVSTTRPSEAANGDAGSTVREAHSAAAAARDRRIVP